MKKELLATVFLIPLMILPIAAEVAATNVDVTLDGIIVGIIPEQSPNEISNRKLHIRVEEQPDDIGLTLTLDLPETGWDPKKPDKVFPLVTGETYNIVLFEVRINLRNARALIAWGMSIREGLEEIKYRFCCYGTGVQNELGDYTITVDTIEVLQKGGDIHGPQYKRIWSETISPTETLTIIF